jgi:hypothetical protein
VLNRAEDPGTPVGVHALGQLDARFAVTYEASVPIALTLVADYFTALARRDIGRVVELCHFPLASYEGGELDVVESAEQLRTDPPRSGALG